MSDNEYNDLKIDVSTIKAKRNHILVKPFLKSTDTIDILGIDIWIDKTYEKEKHAATTGSVVSVCDDLYFSMVRESGMAEKSCRFDTTVEVETGDKIYFHYLSVQSARKEGKLFKAKDGEYYMFLKYDESFCVKRGDSIIMTNGWILLEPIVASEKFMSKYVHIPDMQNQKESIKFAKVAHVGNKIKNYLEDSDAYDFDEEINPGDIIAYDRHSNIPLQYSLHSDIEGSQNFLRMQRNDICAVVTDSEFSITE